jgi:hypothetical protein
MAGVKGRSGRPGHCRGFRHDLTASRFGAEGGNGFSSDVRAQGKALLEDYGGEADLNELAQHRWPSG